MADDLAEPGGYQLIILEASGCEPEALGFSRRLRARLGDGFVPVLAIAADRLDRFEEGTDAVLLRPFAPAELLAQARAMLRVKELHDRLAEKTAEVHRVNRRLQQAYQQIDEELELARRIQMSFLPQPLPEPPGLRFASRYLLCGRVGGDFYDAFRLDEGHVGFYVADAMGHGVPASLLTIFVKKGVRPKEVFGQQYRLVPPAEVLRRLNRELVEQQLSDQPFITMVYALYDHRERLLRFARAGHPHPLLVPREGEPRLLQTHGSLLGVFDTDFQEASCRLNPGDKLLLYTDGLDPGRFAENEDGTASLLACAARHRGLPVDEFLGCLARDLLGGTEQADDVTMVGMEVS
ncbi:MAG TPA: SpoIIE family protein phosphatase, partial [Gemmataceae bacterium]|nr:SpoIIE family protein phosphatase [Gemmataceae bacterium]